MFRPCGRNAWPSFKFLPSSSSPLLTSPPKPSSTLVVIQSALFPAKPLPLIAPQVERLKMRIVQNPTRSHEYGVRALQKSHRPTFHASGTVPRRLVACLRWGGLLLLYIVQSQALFVQSIVFICVLDLPFSIPQLPLFLASGHRTWPPRRPCSRRRTLGYHPVKVSFLSDAAAPSCCRCATAFAFALRFSSSPSSRFP
jgi:hypothetical protein